MSQPSGSSCGFVFESRVKSRVVQPSHCLATSSWGRLMYDRNFLRFLFPLVRSTLFPRHIQRTPVGNQLKCKPCRRSSVGGIYSRRAFYVLEFEKSCSCLIFWSVLGVGACSVARWQHGSRKGLPPPPGKHQKGICFSWVCSRASVMLKYL